MSIYRRGPGRLENGRDSAPSSKAGDRQPGAGLRRLVPAVVATLVLFASACGTTTEDASSQGSEGDGGAAVTASSDSQDGTTDTAEDTADEIEVEGEAEPVDDPESGSDVAAQAVNVPAVEVLDVADGSVINLADELAGEDRAILFWFWAPH